MSIQNLITKVVMIMSISSFLFGSAGCDKAVNSVQHKSSDITSVSIAFSCMDRSISYHFLMHKEQDKWLFDTNCFTQNNKKETTLENCEVTNDEVEALLNIIERNDSIAYAAKYKKPLKPLFRVEDASSYNFSLKFSDGTQSTAYECQKDLEVFFYGLAEKYSKPTAQHKTSDINEIYISSTASDYGSSYNFTLYQNGGKWFFDAKCFIYETETDVDFEMREVSKQDVEEVLKIIEDGDLIAFAENYRAPEESEYKLLDETTYCFSLTFSDGTRYYTKNSQGNIEDFFYSLAKKIN